MRLVLAVALGLAGRVAVADTLLRDARVVDARGVVAEQTDLLLQGGRITAMGDLAPGEGVDVLELAGATVVPGLIDCHVHISMAPGAGWRDPPAEGVDNRRGLHLRSYLAWGVTTILDPGVTVDDATAIEAWIAAGNPAPRTLWAGPLLSPPGGYVAVVIPGMPEVHSTNEVAPLISSFDGLQRVGVKMTLEEGALRPIWPLHSPAIQAAIAAETARRGLDLYVHAMDSGRFLDALQLRPHALVHGPMEPLGAEGAAAVAAAGPSVITTLTIVRAMLQEWAPQDLDDSRLVETVPADELETARTRGRQARLAMAELYTPRLPGFMRQLGVGMLMGRRALSHRLASEGEALVELAAAGVPLVVGSDAGNWPILPFLFHGPSTWMELQALHEAGLSNLAVLTAATRTPAQMLHLDQDIGTVEVGKIADLVVVAGDPLVDLSVLRSPLWTIRAGEARTPEEWMTGGPVAVRGPTIPR